MSLRPFANIKDEQEKAGGGAVGQGGQGGRVGRRRKGSMAGVMVSLAVLT